MGKGITIGTPEIISVIILLMSSCKITFAQSPYAMFGDNSKMLYANSEPILSVFRVGIQTMNEVIYFADFDLNKGIATIMDKEGNIILQDSISENAKAMFTSPDPHAENYYHVSPYVYCGGNPVNRTDPTGMDWVEGPDGNIFWINSVNSSNHQEVLQPGYIYREELIISDIRIGIIHELLD